MPRKRCAWGLCNSDNKYKDRPHMDGVSFRPFPQPKTQIERCLLWIRRCNRPHTQLNVDKITRFIYVCSKHFEAGCDNPVSACSGDRVVRRRKAPERSLQLQPQVAGVEMETEAESETSTSTSEARETGPAPDPPQTEPLDLSTTSRLPNLDFDSFAFPNPDPFSVTCSNCGHKNDIPVPQVNKISRARFMKKVQSNDKKCFFYTGFPTLPLLYFFFSWLSPFVDKIKLWDGSKHSTDTKQRKRARKCLTPFEEFILTLVRLRRGMSVVELGDQFDVSDSYVSRIFIAWVIFLDQCFSVLLKWPSRELTKANMPKCFAAYPNTRTVIDCTEYFTQKPRRPHAQRATYSAYKHTNRFKQLVAIMPSGMITFVSNLYAGNISDQAVVKNCGFLDKIEPGDDVMADRGFNIQHLLLEKGATLNIPAFTHGKNMSLKAVKRSRKIARVRIHIERAIGRMKSFKILQGIVPLKLRFYLNSITKIIAVLCNLQGRLAK